MRAKPFYLTARLQTDGQTDGQGDSSIPPPNFVAGGIKMYMHNKAPWGPDWTKIAHAQLDHGANNMWP